MKIKLSRHWKYPHKQIQMIKKEALSAFTVVLKYSQKVFATIHTSTIQPNITSSLNWFIPILNPSFPSPQRFFSSAFRQNDSQLLKSLSLDENVVTKLTIEKIFLKVRGYRDVKKGLQAQLSEIDHDRKVAHFKVIKT